MIKKAFKDSKEMIKGKRLKTIGLYLIYVLLVGMFTSIYAPAGITLVAIPAMFGIYYYFLNLKEGKDQLEDLIEFYKDWKTGLKLMLALLWYFLIVTIGFCLLVVPGIIWSYRYVMVFFILIQNRDMKVEDAFKKSKEMMHGHKFKYFIAALTFMIIPLIIYFVSFGMIFASNPTADYKNYIMTNVENGFDRNDFGLDSVEIDFEEYDDDELIPEFVNEMMVPQTNYPLLYAGLVLLMISAVVIILISPRVMAVETAYYLALVEKESQNSSEQML